MGLLTIMNLHEHLPKIIQFAKQFLDPADDLHGLKHVQRVVAMATSLQRKEGGQLELIQTIAWLHDVGRKFEKEKNQHHAEISASMAENHLSQSNIDLHTIQLVKEGILGHSFSIGGKAKFLEAQIVSDADKLDALGSIGIYRECAYQAKMGSGIEAVIQHCDDKLLRLRDQLYLKTSKKIANKRTKTIKTFQSQLRRESII